MGDVFVFLTAYKKRNKNVVIFSAMTEWQTEQNGK